MGSSPGEYKGSKIEEAVRLLRAQALIDARIAPLILNRFLKEADLPDTPNLSYTSNAANAYSIGALSPFHLTSTPITQGLGLNRGLGLQARLDNMFTSTKSTQNEPQTINIVPTEVQKMGARLISYFVVDPDVHLHKDFPEKAVLTSGQRMISGDDRGFLLDIAAELADLLLKHNISLTGLVWETEKGESKVFKTRKLSDLDVVVTLIKQY